MIVRREVYSELGGFDPEFFLYSEETDFCLRLRERGYEIGLVKRRRGRHIGGASERWPRSLRGVDSSRERTAPVLEQALPCRKMLISCFAEIASARDTPMLVNGWLARFQPRRIERLAKTPPLSRDLGNLKITPGRASQSKMNLRGLIKYALFRDTTMKGEFGIMRKLVREIGRRYLWMLGRTMVSTVRILFRLSRGAGGPILIEPHPLAFERLQKLHAGKRRTTCLNIACAEKDGEFPLYLSKAMTPRARRFAPTIHRCFRVFVRTDYKMVRVERLETVLKAHGIPEDFGILSIDAEGMDYEVLLGLDSSAGIRGSSSLRITSPKLK